MNPSRAESANHTASSIDKENTSQLPPTAGRAEDGIPIDHEAKGEKGSCAATVGSRPSVFNLAWSYIRQVKCLYKYGVPATVIDWHELPLQPSGYLVEQNGVETFILVQVPELSRTSVAYSCHRVATFRKHESERLSLNECFSLILLNGFRSSFQSSPRPGLLVSTSRLLIPLCSPALTGRLVKKDTSTNSSDHSLSQLAQQRLKLTTTAP